MPRQLSALLLTLALIITPMAQATSPAPAAEATRIISEFGLREAASPISEHPRWQPRRVVISLPHGLAGRMPGFEQDLQEIAGEVELVIDRSENFVLSKDVLAGADAVIGVCSPATINNASSQLLWWHNYFVGIEKCTGLPAAATDGRLFSNSKRLSGPAIAEHTIAMMMSLARGLPAYIRADSWDREPARKVSFGDINGKTMLVVGLGGIGSQIAWRAHGLGMQVNAIRNSSRLGPDLVDYVGLPDELHALAGKADVVVNALPLTDKTTGLFDRAFFDAIKPGALFLSVGRGKSTVTADLVAALEGGKLYGAGLDVTEPEPLPADSELWAMDNVIITPHVSAAGQGSMHRVAVIAAENLRRYLAGEPLLNLVNMRAGY